jgi:hypothetical protein
VTIPSGLLPRCPGTQKVALGEGPWAVQEAGSLDRGRVCYALPCVVLPYASNEGTLTYVETGYMRHAWCATYSTARPTSHDPIHDRTSTPCMSDSVPPIDHLCVTNAWCMKCRDMCKLGSCSMLPSIGGSSRISTNEFYYQSVF